MFYKEEQSGHLEEVWRAGWFYRGAKSLGAGGDVFYSCGQFTKPNIIKILHAELIVFKYLKRHCEIHGTIQTGPIIDDFLLLKTHVPETEGWDFVA